MYDNLWSYIIVLCSQIYAYSNTCFQSLRRLRLTLKISLVVSKHTQYLCVFMICVKKNVMSASENNTTVCVNDSLSLLDLNTSIKYLKKVLKYWLCKIYHYYFYYLPIIRVILRLVICKCMLCYVTVLWSLLHYT